MLFKYTKTKITKKNIKSLGLADYYRLQSKVVITSNTIGFKSQAIILFSIPTQLIEFFNLWPVEQWVWSLIGLVLLYWATTKLYNKRLKAKYDLELSVIFRIYMILSDLLINLAVGLYYMDYRTTMMGALTRDCPIAISPGIFLIELILVILWNEIYKKNK